MRHSYLLLLVFSLLLPLHPEEEQDPLAFFESILPGDVLVSGCLHWDSADTMEIMGHYLNKEKLKSINDLILEGRRYNRNWNVSSTRDLLDFCENLFGRKACFAFRLEKGEETSSAATALFMKINDMKAFVDLEKTMVEMQNNLIQSFEVWGLVKPLYHSKIKGISLPDSGDGSFQQVVYTVVGDDSLLISNSLEFLEDILKIRAEGKPG